MQNGERGDGSRSRGGICPTARETAWRGAASTRRYQLGSNTKLFRSVAVDVACVARRFFWRTAWRPVGKLEQHTSFVRSGEGMSEPSRPGYQKVHVTESGLTMNRKLSAASMAAKISPSLADSGVLRQSTQV